MEQGKTNKKSSFVLYKSFWPPIKDLSNERLGQLFRALMEYQTSGSINNVPPELEMAFNFFVTKFREDDEKYEKICEQRRKAAGQRWKETD